jgi:glycerol-3-phosphate O-acyltransferase
LQKHIASEESIPGEMFTTGIKLATHRGLIAPTNPDIDLAVGRASLQAELGRLHQAISTLAAISDSVSPRSEATPWGLPQNPNTTGQI